MKLSIKIFLSISICAIISILVISSLVINKNHQININRENQRGIQEFEIILSSINSNPLMINKENTYDFIKKYVDYYNNQDLNFVILKNNVQQYSTIEKIEVDEILLNTTNKDYITKIEVNEEKEYILICSVIDSEYKIIYVRDITSIFSIKQEMQKYGIALILVSILILLIISYVISKSIINPLNDIKKNMLNISNGDLTIKLNETKDELGQVSKAFNKMSDDIKDRNEDLLKLVESKQMFIDNLSHEMNTPLTTIQGYAELLEKVDCSEEQRIKFLQYIQDETKRIKEMYKKLLLISYKKNDDLQIQEEDFHIIVEEIKMQLQQKMMDSKIILVVNDNLDKLMCDKTLIEIAISNLITNAMHVSKEGDRIILNAYETDNEKIIEVIDEGCGISKEDISKIVEPFYRVDKARSRKLGGAGLGLTMCTNIIRMNRAVLEIESEIGQGSTFRIIFNK